MREEVAQARPGLLSGFRRKFSLSGKSSGSEIDFVGSHYATCFAAINPKGAMSGRTRNASAALWRLARARDAFGFAAPATIELTAWTPLPGLPLYTRQEYSVVKETLQELSAQAAREELLIFSAPNAEIASRRLLEVEAVRPS